MHLETESNVHYSYARSLDTKQIQLSLPLRQSQLDETQEKVGAGNFARGL